jgi:hypothetical protein
MDALYYWKNFDADLKASRIGYFKSATHKLRELHDGYPDFIWVIKTPKGRKGEAQVVARLRWLDKPAVRIEGAPGQAYMYYDPEDSKSVHFVDGDSEPAISATNNWVGRYFPAMLAANFQGATGQESLRGHALSGLVELTSSFKREPFTTIAG